MWGLGCIAEDGRLWQNRIPSTGLSSVGPKLKILIINGLYLGECGFKQAVSGCGLGRRAGIVGLMCLSVSPEMSLE